MSQLERLVDLASERLGGAAIAASDDFFAPRENLLRAAPATFDPDRYTDRGKWMDGWETRRLRGPGHDWCVVRLGLGGRVRAVDVDTRHFKGNAPEACSLDASPDGSAWTEILPRAPLRADSQNLLPVADDRPWTHLRLHIYPDGGVARLRVWGEVAPDWDRLARAGEIDLAAVEHGGLPVATSDAFFSDVRNLVMPGPPAGMHDGWETRRRRGPGHDWAIVRLGRPGRVRRVEVDTSFFKGNYPESCSLDASRDGAAWTEILSRAKLGPDARHCATGKTAAEMLALLRARLGNNPDEELRIAAAEQEKITRIRLERWIRE